MKHIHSSLSNRGEILIPVLVFGAIGIILLTGFISWASVSVKTARQTIVREQALQAAEAGIEYYRWHLAHAPQDFTDGTNAAGPYVHPYTDKDGKTIGSFSLSITPPAPGSTVVTIQSTGKITAIPLSPMRKIQVRLAIPTIAKYAVVSNSDVRFGQGTEVFGPIHSNGGIHFDGLAHNVVESSKSTYDDPDHTGGNEFGVHTHLPPIDPLPPAALPSRPDVFAAGRTFPVPTIDFTGMTVDLAQMKTSAQAQGIYLPASGALGYHIVLKTNDTMDVYKVTALTAAPNTCVAPNGATGWGTWSIKTQTLLSNRPFPSNGLVFVEDHAWVDGQIDSARLTIASGKFPDIPATRTSITVNSDLRYTNTNGQDVIGLFAQGDINVGMTSSDTLRIDAALVAQNGRVGRHYYSSPQCSPYHTRNSLTLFGMIASNQRYGFAYTDGTGYQIRNLNYDANLLYNPPPNFPVTSNQYTVLSWREVP